MRATDKFDEPVEISLGETDPQLRFDTAPDVFTWAAREREFWQALRGKVSQAVFGEPSGSNALQEVMQRLNGALAQVENLRAKDATRADYINAVLPFANLVKAKSLITSNGRIGTYLVKLSEADPDKAFRVALAYCTPVLPLNQNTALKWMRAAALAEAVDKGFADVEPSMSSVFGKTLEDWNTRYRAIELEERSRLDDQTNSAAAMATRAEQFGQDVEAARTRGDELNAELVGKTDAAIADSDARVKAMLETYNARMALEAPTTYWAAKRKGHRTAVFWWSAAFVVMGALAALGVWFVWTLTVAPLLGAVEKLGRAPPSYGFFLPTLGASFLAIWILRLISRQILSNLALSSDAGERVAMVMTFLALMQKPEHVTEPDRILILGSLFRPASPVQDDGAPPHWFDLLMERMKPKG